MDAREIESLNLISRGFTELGQVNPELAYNVMVDILSGINECVFFSLLALAISLRLYYPNRNNSIRRHIATQKGLFPHRLIRRKTEMTAKGLVVVEQEEEVPPIPPPKAPLASPPASPTPPKRSPISDLLYMRWMEGLRIKWSGITAA
jgi:serine/threonine-protein kinase 24/25/MST4